MYSEGEERYLKDLDCVTIVKAIRELKAMSRVILTQQQRQLLAFERESVLPTSRELEGLEEESIHNKVPLETVNNFEITEYLNPFFYGLISNFLLSSVLFGLENFESPFGVIE